MSSDDYTLLNKHEYPNGLHAAGYRLIYVLLSNIPGIPSRPYYVGQAKSVSRFVEHVGITWHIRKTGSPPQVWIAGIVRRSEANAAEQDMISRLSAHGYKLINRDIRDSQARAFQSTFSLGDMTDNKVIRYFQSKIASSTCLTDWQKQWSDSLRGDDDAPIRVDPLTALYTNADGSDVRTHSSYVTAARDITGDELALLILRQDANLYAHEGKGGTMLKMLALTLAGGYDPGVGYVSMSSTEVQRGSGMSQATVSRSSGPLCQTGLWGYVRGEGWSTSKFYPLFVEGVADQYLALTSESSVALTA